MIRRLPIEVLRGVHWNRQRSKWKAAIWIAPKTKHLGFFVDEAEAARAYDAAAREHFGGFARLNFPQEIPA